MCGNGTAERALLPLIAAGEQDEVAFIDRRRSQLRRLCAVLFVIGRQALLQALYGLLDVRATVGETGVDRLLADEHAPVGYRIQPIAIKASMARDCVGEYFVHLVDLGLHHAAPRRIE